MSERLNRPRIVSTGFTCNSVKPWVSVMKSTVFLIFVFFGSLAPVGLGLLFVEVSKSHSDTAHSVGLL